MATPQFPHDMELKRLKKRRRFLKRSIRRARVRKARFVARRRPRSRIVKVNKFINDRKKQLREVQGEITRRRKSLRERLRLKPKEGLVYFDGRQIAAWIAPTLHDARKSGQWTGRVNSGYRSVALQASLYYGAPRNGLIRGVTVARPGASNHNFYKHPRGAVDVSDPWGLNRYIHSHKTPLKSYLDVLGNRDPWHFSTSGHAFNPIALLAILQAFYQLLT